MPSRYYFNLTNSDQVIRDEEGTEAPDAPTVLVFAFEAIAELRQEDALSLNGLQGWRLDIIDGSGTLIHSLQLDSTAPDQSSHH